VGAGLPAMAEYQATVMLEVRASSRASPLPQGASVNTGFVGDKNPIVGAGLLAKAGCQAIVMLDVRASSRASPLPQGCLVNTGFVGDKIQLWERACSGRRSDDGGVSGASDVGSAGLIAGEPAPTGGFGEHGICV
jgi:hypothetical protein